MERKSLHEVCCATWRRAAAAGSLILLALAGCGGGGGGQASGGDTLQIRSVSSSIADGQAGIDPRVEVLIDFNVPPGTQGLNETVLLTSGDSAVPLTLTVNGNQLKVTPVSALKSGTDYVLTLKAGFKAANKTVLGSDQVARFRTNPLTLEYRELVPASTRFQITDSLLVAAGDLDGDGRSDLVRLTGLPYELAPGLEQGYALTIFLQNAAGGFDQAQEIDQFIQSTGQAYSFTRLLLLDVDGDGRKEIVVAEHAVDDTVPQGLRIFAAGADGRFAERDFIGTRNSRRIDVLDVDGDGRLDLVGSHSGNYIGALQVFWHKNGQLLPSAEVALPAGSYEVVALDVGGNGRKDLVVLVDFGGRSSANDPLRQFKVFSNALGVLSEEAALANRFAAVCAEFDDCRNMTTKDIDADGLTDLVFARPGVAYLRTADGGFARAGFPRYGYGDLILLDGDMDVDGRSDIVMIDIVPRGLWNDVVIGVGLDRDSEGFEYTSAFVMPPDTPQAGRIVLDDLDADGLPDAVVISHNYGIGVMRQLTF